MNEYLAWGITAIVAIVTACAGIIGVSFMYSLWFPPSCATNEFGWPVIIGVSLLAGVGVLLFIGGDLW